MVETQFDQFKLISPASHPEYRRMVAPLASASWPEFMLHDPISDENWGALFERFPNYQFGLLDLATDQAVAMGNSVPLYWEGELASLPEEGWDWALEQAVQNDQTAVTPNIQCAIQVAIHPDYRGRGLSTRMIQAMKAIGHARGFQLLIAPVRPSQKANYPLSAIDGYVTWKTGNGLPFDAWLRVHVRAGARIVKVCHRSMIIRGTHTEWQSWTEMEFPETGQYYVPGALNPVEMDLEKDQGTYIEPNVWMVHAPV